MAALALARLEMATETVELCIAQAIRSKLPLDSNFIFNPRGEVGVFRQQDCRCCSLVKVLRTSGNAVNVSDGAIVGTYGISQVKLCHADLCEGDFKRLLMGLQKNSDRKKGSGP